MVVPLRNVLLSPTRETHVRKVIVPLALSMAFSPSSGEKAKIPTKENAGPDDETEIVPIPVVVNFVDVHIVVNQRDDEGDD